MTILPVRKIRIDTAGQSFASAALQTFEYYNFEPGTYTLSQLAYMHQSGHQIPYAKREELVADLVIFTASQYAALLAFGSVDVEITCGMPGETATVITFFATRLVLNYNITEGVQKLKITALQITTAGGTVIPVSQAVFGYGSGPTTFSVDLVECRIGVQVISLPYRNVSYTDVERVIGKKRRATISIAPSALTARQGFGSSLEAWLMNSLKYLRTYNFHSESGGTEAFRQVVCLNSEEIVEERLDGLYAGRNIVIDVADKEMS